MLKVLDFTHGTTASECASAIVAAFPASKVLHLRGLGRSGDMRSYFTEVFALAGEMKALAEDARIGDRGSQRTGEFWFEVRYDPSIPDAYRHSANAQPLHTDGSYIPGFPNAGFLGCVSMTSDGGETIFLDGVDLVRIFEQRRPDLLERVLSQPVPHKRSGDFRELPVIRNLGAEPLLNWNYYCVDPDCTDEVRQLQEELFEFLRDEPMIAEALIEVKLAPGEAVIWKDDRVLHGRKSFHAERESERFLWKTCVDIGA
jgi:alpha-ketoglutarate-dependent taurine dioxygenase